MKKIITFAIALIAATGSLFAQQEAMYSQYMFNTLAINPAYAGSRNVISATGLLRSQWTSMPGAPKTSTFTIDAPIEEKRMALGLQIFSDKIGITSSTGAYGTYAYRIRMEKASLSFGIQAGVSQFKAAFSSVALTSEGYNGDKAFSNDVSKLLLNFGTGVYYNSDKFYVGLSSPQILQNKISDIETEEGNSLSVKNTHIFLASGYVLPLNSDFSFKPSVLVKAVKGAPIEADLNGTVWIKNRLAIGAQYRTNAAVAGMLEIQMSSQLRMGYAYDYSTTNLQSYNSGSHEIMLRYEFGGEKSKIISPRYF